MWCLSVEDLPERHVAQPHRLALPAGEQLDQAPRIGREPGAAAPGAAARGGEHLGTQHALHFTDAVQAGAVAPADFAARRPDGPGAIDRVEKPQVARPHEERAVPVEPQDRKSTRLNSSHSQISYAVFCLKKKKKKKEEHRTVYEVKGRSA